MSKSISTTVVTRRLYRNLLRTSKPFTAPSPNAAVLMSLLHRTGIDDHIQDWNSFVSQDHKTNREERAKDLAQSYSKDAPPTVPTNRTYQRLFRRLLREVVTGTEHYGKMAFPSQADTSVLRKVIRREFRGNQTASSYFDDHTRRQVAFVALRELNKKLSYHDWLQEHSPEPIPQQAAKYVSSLPLHPPSSYLRPGVFLVSHPYMNDSYFSKTVICILEHKAPGEDSQNSSPGQTYGIIVNRVSTDAKTGKHRTLQDVFREHLLPETMAQTFGDACVREGGPVHVSLQMIHSVSDADTEELSSSIGGTIIPSIYDEDDENPGLSSDKATYFRGNMFKVMSHIEDGRMDRVGASIWSQGQLAAEIAQGYWIPCRGPPEMALDGICEHESTSSGNRPLADLWLSMMSACGTEEAKLSHLFHKDHWDEHGMPCDASFEDEEDDENIVVF